MRKVPDPWPWGPWSLVPCGPLSMAWSLIYMMNCEEKDTLLFWPWALTLEPWPWSLDLGVLTLEPWPWSLSQVKDELWGEGHSHHRPLRSHRSANSCSYGCLFPLLQAKGCLKHAQCIVDLILKLAVTSVLRWESESNHQSGREGRGDHHCHCQSGQSPG